MSNEKYALNISLGKEFEGIISYKRLSEEAKWEGVLRVAPQRQRKID